MGSKVNWLNRGGDDRYVTDEDQERMMKSKNGSDVEKTRNGKIWDPIWDDLNEIIASFNPHLVANSFPDTYHRTTVPMSFHPFWAFFDFIRPWLVIFCGCFRKLLQHPQQFHKFTMFLEDHLTSFTRWRMWPYSRQDSLSNSILMERVNNITLDKYYIESQSDHKCADNIQVWFSTPYVTRW